MTTTITFRVPFEIKTQLQELGEGPFASTDDNGDLIILSAGDVARSVVYSYLSSPQDAALESAMMSVMSQIKSEETWNKIAEVISKAAFPEGENQVAGLGGRRRGSRGGKKRG